MSEAPQFRVSEASPSGLASHDGTLYLAGSGTDALYTLDGSTIPPAPTVTYTGPQLHLGYTFDPGANVTGLTDTRHGNQTFSYDAERKK